MATLLTSTRNTVGHRDYFPPPMLMGLGDAPSVFATSPSGVIQFSDGSVYDPDTGIAFDVNGNVTSTGGPTTAQTDAMNAQLSNQLSQAGMDLQTLSDAAASNAQVAAAIQVKLAAANQQFTELAKNVQDWVNSETGFWSALELSVPPISFVKLYQIVHQGQVYSGQIAALQQNIAAMKQQVASIQQAQTSITSSSATQYAALAAAARSAGNQALATQYDQLAQSAQTTARNQSQAQLQPAGGSGTDKFLAWVENNALWIGLAAAAIFIGPTIVKKL